jgi:hypothetical protein
MEARAYKRDGVAPGVYDECELNSFCVNLCGQLYKRHLVGSMYHDERVVLIAAPDSQMFVSSN